MRLLLAVVVGFLTLIGIGASIFHYIDQPYNPGFLLFPAMTALHISLGSVYLALAPFQFVKQIRTRWPKYHRWQGRVIVVTGLITGVTALFMGVLIPFSGWPETIYVSIFGSLFVVDLCMGTHYVRAGQIVLHREWMIRAYAIGLSIATMRVIFIPALVIIGEPTYAQVATLSNMSFVTAFIVHTVFAELWIRSTRQHATLRKAPATAVTPRP